MPAGRTIRTVYVLLLSSVALAACGGGGGGNPGNQRRNSAPTAQNLSSTVAEDDVVTGTLQAQDTDGDALTFSISTQTSNGTLTLSGSSFTYRPRTNFFGVDQFTYTASDGQATSNAATVSLQITSVNDPPQFSSAPTAPATSPARRRVEVAVSVVDVDGTVTLTAQQTSGPAVQQLETTPNQVAFNTPDVTQVQTIAIQLLATDDQGATATAPLSLSVLPASSTGNLTTILGSPTAPGIQWVITGDGYRAEELPSFRQNAIAAASFVLDTAEIAAYKPAWNVHLLDAVSNESGMDVPSEGIFRDTVFNAAADCSGIDRLVCVSTSRVANAVIAELPTYDFILVLVNSPRYGGSGGNISVATTNVSSPLITLHEFGHSFADLADEYVDAAAAPTYLPFYREDAIPNVTRLTTLNQIKWRHWFADPNNVPQTPGAAGVGLFEGAYYHATGFFRPKSDSFMRTLSRTMGEVNTEAWALSVYSVAGAVTASLPTSSTVAVTPGNAATFSVSRLLAPASQSIAWFVDGVERTGSRNSPTFACCTELIGQHTVQAVVQDATGRIRAPDPRSSRFQRTWTLTIQ